MKKYYLREKRGGNFYIAHINLHMTRTTNLHTSAQEFEFTNEDEASGFCKAVKVLTGSEYIAVRKRKNM